MFSGVSAFAEGWEIVVVPKDASNPWFVRMEVGVNEYAEAHPENTIYQRGTPEIDATLQAQLVQDLIAQGVDAICVVPVDPESLEPVLEQARAAGIVAVSYTHLDVYKRQALGCARKRHHAVFHEYGVVDHRFQFCLLYTSRCV